MNQLFERPHNAPSNIDLFNKNPYQKQARSKVLAHSGDNSIVLDPTIFYPSGGGQPSDQGKITFGDYQLSVVESTKNLDGTIALMLGQGVDRPPVGMEVVQDLDWDRRFHHMRLHTALHLLTVALPFPVTGGQISSDKARLDFNMPALTQTKQELQDQLNNWIASDFRVDALWLSTSDYEQELSLVKTANAKPPIENGHVRIVRIGNDEKNLDAQACGGTHVSRTSEIGSIAVGKIENKGRDNRRVTVRVSHGA